jgi:hypothetical protein
VRRIVAERTGHGLALEINASLARQRLSFVRDPLVAEELELVIALASQTPRPELAGRISAAARAWADRDAARLAALIRAADALEAGNLPPLVDVPRTPFSRPAPMPRPAPALIVDDPDEPAPNEPAPNEPAPNESAPNESAPNEPAPNESAPIAPSERQRRESRGYGLGPSTHREDAVRSGQSGGNRAKIAVAVVAVAAVAIGAVIVLNGRGSEKKEAAARSEEIERKEAGRKGEEKKDEPAGEIKIDEAAFAEQQRMLAEQAMADAAPASLEYASTPEQLAEMQRVALDTGDVVLLGKTIADDVHHWGPEAVDLLSGRDAVVAALRDLVPPEPPIVVASTSSGRSPDGETAWWLDEITWAVERAGRKPVESRYLVARVAMKRGDRWEIVASSWAKRASDRKLAEAAFAGLLPALAPLPDAPPGVAAPVDSLRTAWATDDAVVAAIADHDGVIALGSANERDEGTAAVEKRYRELGGRLFVGDGARHAISAAGQSGWVAANLELVMSSRDSGDVVVPYRLLAAMTFDEAGQAWRIAMLHASFGGPMPRVPATSGAVAPDDDGDEPAADPRAVPADVAPLTAREIRAAFTAIRHRRRLPRDRRPPRRPAARPGQDHRRPHRRGHGRRRHHRGHLGRHATRDLRRGGGRRHDLPRPGRAADRALPVRVLAARY